MDPLYASTRMSVKQANLIDKGKNSFSIRHSIVRMQDGKTLRRNGRDLIPTNEELTEN